MVVDKEGFTRVIPQFLSASAKSVGEIENCWSEMHQFTASIDQVIQPFALSVLFPWKDNVCEGPTMAVGTLVLHLQVKFLVEFILQYICS